MPLIILDALSRRSDAPQSGPVSSGLDVYVVILKVLGRMI